MATKATELGQLARLLTIDSNGVTISGTLSATTLSGNGAGLTGVTSYTDSDTLSYLTTNTYATQSYVTGAVNAVIDAAPGAMDTLNELAAALNDDPNAFNTLQTLINANLDSADAVLLIDSDYVRQRAAKFVHDTYRFTATSGQTTFSGSDTASKTLDYTQSNLFVQLNGVNLVDNADFTATNGTSIVLDQGADSGDDLVITAFNHFDTTFAQAFEYTHRFVATTGQTDFSGSDVDGNVLIFNAQGTIVSLNGLTLQPTIDYTASNGTNVVLVTSADSADELLVRSFAKLEVADTVSATNGGTFGNNITVNGNIIVTGTVDGVDVAATATTANAALPKAGGTMTGALNVNNTISSNKGSAGTLATFTDGVNSNFVVETSSLLTTIGNGGGSTALAFKSNNTTGMTLDAAGNVGIGTSSVAARLEVASPASTPAVLRLSSNKTGTGSGDRGRLDFYSADNSGTAYQLGYMDYDRSDGTGTASYIAWGNRVAGTVAERMRINSSGNLAFPAGKGIDFSATTSYSGTVSTSSEVLDDYEEGTYMPTVGGSASFGTRTYGQQTGVYTKIGNMVRFSGSIQYSGQSGTTGTMVISIPFTTSSSASWQGSFILGYQGGFTTIGHVGYTDPGRSDFFIRNEGQSSGTIQWNQMPSSAHIIFGGTFQTDS